MTNHWTILNHRFTAWFWITLQRNLTWFWLDQREWKKHLWMKSNQSNNQYSKLTSIEHTRMHQVDWRFGDLEYLNTINIQHLEILFNVTERGYQKLSLSELIMDVRFGRSTIIHFKSVHYYFALSMNLMNHVFHEVHNTRV